MPIASYYRLEHLEKLQMVMDYLDQTDHNNVVSQLAAINAAYATWQANQNNNQNSQVGIITRDPRRVALDRSFYRSLCRDLASWIGVPYRGGGKLRVVV